MSLVTLADVKQFLDIPTSDTTNDDELVDFIDAASAVVEFYTGDLAGSTYTEQHDGGDATIYARHTPVRSVTSLTEYVGSITYPLTNQPLGQSVNAWGFTIDDPMSGRIVRRSASGMAWRFAPGVGNVTLTYTTGVDNIPPQVIKAVQIIVGHLWDTQRGPQPLPVYGGSDDGTTSVPGIGYAIPNRAVELLQTVPRMPVIG